MFGSFYYHSKNSKTQDNCKYVKSRDDGIPAYPKWLSIFFKFLIYIYVRKSERVFSGASRTICRLGSQTIERSECLKNWIKSGITQGILIECRKATLIPLYDGTLYDGVLRPLKSQKIALMKILHNLLYIG